jgi:hypothetical protein
MKRARMGSLLAFAITPLTLTAACGARSGLFGFPGDLPTEAGATDAGATVEDAPTIVDVVLPGLDVRARDVVPLSICADAADTLIYAVTEQNTLVKFNPSSAQFTPIGSLSCPDPYGRSPFSMAVDRQGNAYVLYFAPAQGGAAIPGDIFKVDLNNAHCQPTAYVPGQQGFLGFGMGFVADDVGTGETLYVASGDTTPMRLGAMSEKTFALSLVGSFPAGVLGAELTGTGDGRLFGFYKPSSNVGGSAIGEIDKHSGAVVAQVALPQVTQGTGWAFAFWGGDFYTFTSPDSQGTIVQRYRPADGTVVQVATYPDVIDGAGVSTCAPVE